MLKISCCGIPRSGSTLCYQILHHLFPDIKIPRSHPGVWRPDGSWAFVTIRHPYDLVSSLYRLRSIRSHPPQVNERETVHLMNLLFGDDEAQKIRCTKILADHREYLSGPPGLGAGINQVLKHYAGLSIWKDDAKCIILRYEDFVNNYDIIYDAVEKYLKQIVVMGERKEMDELFALDANRNRSIVPQTAEQFLRYEIHPGHIGAVTPGSWKHIIPEWRWPILKKRCGALAKEWGYEA